jgi:hypothetical protein
MLSKFINTPASKAVREEHASVWRQHAMFPLHVAPRARPGVPMMPSVARTGSSRFRGKRKGSAGHSILLRGVRTAPGIGACEPIEIVHPGAYADSHGRTLLGRVGVRAVSDIVRQPG